VVVALIFGGQLSKAQTVVSLKGFIAEYGKITGIAGASIYNKQRFTLVKSDAGGKFQIDVLPGDSLKITTQGYSDIDYVVNGVQDVVIYLRRIITLPEVSIKTTSPKDDIKETENAYRAKGIYYGGRPPLSLLSPFGGKPLTFFYELLSKDGRRARRFNNYADSETDYLEVSARFNNYTIQKLAPISGAKLDSFKVIYWPKAEQLRKWNEFDLFSYIKRSYADFLTKTPAF
jgi:hypothetical protein